MNLLIEPERELYSAKEAILLTCDEEDICLFGERVALAMEENPMAAGTNERSDLVKGAGLKNQRLRKPARRIRTTARPKRAAKKGRGRAQSHR